MNVLLLEDRGSVSYYLREYLELNGHDVFEAFNVNDADSLFNDEHIDCIIVDLNMATDGLTKSEISNTREGLLTGWIWLIKHVYAENPDMRERTIIFSEYLERFKNATSKDERRGIHLVPKGDFSGDEDEEERIIRLIEKIGKRAEA